MKNIKAWAIVSEKDDILFNEEDKERLGGYWLSYHIYRKRETARDVKKRMFIEVGYKVKKVEIII